MPHQALYELLCPGHEGCHVAFSGKSPLRLKNLLKINKTSVFLGHAFSVSDSATVQIPVV